MKRRALTGYVGISANMVNSAPKCCCDKCCRKTETVEERSVQLSQREIDDRINRILSGGKLRKLM